MISIYYTIGKIVENLQKGGNTMIGKSKKLVVPVIALMMCAVALAGVAYAYNSSVTTTNNTGDVDFFAIDLYENNGTTPIEGRITASDAGFVVTTATVIGESSKTITATADKVDTIVYAFGFKVTSEDSTQFTVNTTNSSVSLTVDDSGVASLIPAVTTTTSIAVTSQLGIYSDAACTAAAAGNLDVGTVYYAAVEIATITPGVYSYTGNQHSANTLADAIEGAITVTFGLTLVVEPVVA